MNDFLKILASVRHHLYCSVTNPKVWAAGVLILGAIFKVVYPFARIANDYDKPVSFSIAALSFSESYPILLIFCALLLIFSELPFKNPQQIFLITRSGKRSWYLSQLLYIIAVSVLTALIVILISWIIVCGHISFANSWEPVENSAAQNIELILKYDVAGYFRYSIISSFSPMQTFAWSVLVGTLIYIVFGTLIFALNIVARKLGGIICGAILTGYHALMWNFIHPKYKWIAILDWSNIDYIDMQRNTLYPTPEFAVGVLLLLYAAAAVIVAAGSRKKTDTL